jgi:hypothetical protein
VDRARRAPDSAAGLLHLAGRRRLVVHVRLRALARQALVGLAALRLALVLALRIVLALGGLLDDGSPRR